MRMDNEKINIKQLLRKLVSRWYYFVIGVLLMLGLAFAYIKLAPEVYQVRASLLLKQESSDGIKSEKFLKGMGLFTSHTELEDEMGMLSSYSMIETAIYELDFGVSYHTKRNFRHTEHYGEVPFTIELDSAVDQIINVPVYISRITENKYQVRVSADKAEVYNFYTNKVVGRLNDVNFQLRSDTDKPFIFRNLGFRIRFNKSFPLDEDTETYFVIHNLKSLAEHYQENLEIEPLSKESNIVELKLQSKVPEKEVRFLNTLLDVYLKNELYKENQLGLKTIHFIDNQLSGVYDSLKQVEGSLEAFRARSNILDLNTTAENLTKNLDLLEREKADLEVKLKYYKYIAESLQKEGEMKDIVAPSTFGVDDPMLSNLLIEMSRLSQEKIGLKYSAKDGNPLSEVIDLKIKNNRNELIDNVNNYIDASSIAVDDIENRISQVRGNLSRLPRNERELVNIQRKFTFSDNVYNYLLEKRAEAGIAIASNTVQKAVVDSAKQVGDMPVSPNRKMIYLLAFFLGVGGAAALIITKDFLNDNIINHEDVEQSTSIPFLGTIGHGSRRDRANIVVNGKSPLGEAFRSLRVSLQYLTLGKENNVIGFTSSGESEGKTFCSVNLAAAMAQAKRRTILIDADLRKPKVGSYFKLENEKGLSNYLIGYCSTKQAIHETGIKGFDVIPAGPIPPNPLDLIGQPRFEELIRELRQTYNTVIIDAPPIGYVAEYIILMKYTDANIYVVRSDYTSKYDLMKINKLYESKKINNVSILLNDVKASKVNGYTYRY